MPPTPLKEKVPAGNDEQELEMDNHVIAPETSSEDSESENEYEGYEPLPTEPNVAVHQEFPWQDMDSYPADETVPDNHNWANFDSVEDNDEVDSKEEEPVHLKDSDFPIKDVPRPESVQLDESKIETIKNCMAKFELSNSSIPKWANKLSEEEWKDTLLNKIRSHKS